VGGAAGLWLASTHTAFHGWEIALGGLLGAFVVGRIAARSRDDQHTL